MTSLQQSTYFRFNSRNCKVLNINFFLKLKPNPFQQTVSFFLVIKKNYRKNRNI